MHNVNMMLFNTKKIFNKNYYSVFQIKNNTKNETDFIVDVLKLRKNNKILDIGCGNGRHLEELFSRDYRQLNGIDVSKVFVNQACKNNSKIRYINKNFIDIDFGNQKFDKIYSFFSSFGYSSDSENILFIKKVANLLQKEGVFLLDIFNYFYFIRSYKEGKVYRKGNIKNWNEFNPITSVNSSVNIIDGKKYEYKIRLYSISELQTIFNLFNLKIIALYGGYNKESFSIESKRCILVVKK